MKSVQHLSYPGERAMEIAGYRRLASGVWQKVSPCGEFLFRAIVDGSKMTIITEQIQ